MYLAGVGEVDLTRALSQKVTTAVLTVTYFLTSVTQNVLPKTKFGTIGLYARCCRSESSDSPSRNSNRGSGRGSGRSRGRGNY